jgi:hypothetical protein
MPAVAHAPPLDEANVIEDEAIVVNVIEDDFMEDIANQETVWFFCLFFFSFVTCICEVLILIFLCLLFFLSD